MTYDSNFKATKNQAFCPHLHWIQPLLRPADLQEKDVTIPVGHERLHMRTRKEEQATIPPVVRKYREQGQGCQAQQAG